MEENNINNNVSGCNKKKSIGVYVKINNDGCVTEINSDIFIQDFAGWQKIDEGFGDKYAHAQSNYFEKPIIDENGNYLIKYLNENAF